MNALDERRLGELEEKVSKLQAALQSWRDTGFPEKTILVLLSHYTGVPQRTIKKVMDGFDDLYDFYFNDEQT